MNWDSGARRRRGERDSVTDSEVTDHTPSIAFGGTFLQKDVANQCLEFGHWRAAARYVSVSVSVHKKKKKNSA